MVTADTMEIINRTSLASAYKRTMPTTRSILYIASLGLLLMAITAILSFTAAAHTLDPGLRGLANNVLTSAGAAIYTVAILSWKSDGIGIDIGRLAALQEQTAAHGARIAGALRSRAGEAGADGTVLGDIVTWLAALDARSAAMVRELTRLCTWVEAGLDAERAELPPNGQAAINSVEQSNGMDPTTIQTLRRLNRRLEH